MAGGFVAYIGRNDSGKREKKVPSGSGVLYNFPAPREDAEGTRAPVFVRVIDEVDYTYFVWKAKQNPDDWIAKVRTSDKNDVTVDSLKRSRPQTDPNDPNAKSDFERRRIDKEFKDFDEAARKIRIGLVEKGKKKQLLKQLEDLKNRLTGGD